MENVFLTLFLIVLIILILGFAYQLVSKKGETSDLEKAKLSSWVAPAVLRALNESELLTSEDVHKLEGRPLEEIEDYVLQEEIFESVEDFKNWILQQPDIVGSGDSVFGGINRYR